MAAQIRQSSYLTLVVWFSHELANQNFPDLILQDKEGKGSCYGICLHGLIIYCRIQLQLFTQPSKIDFRSNAKTMTSIIKQKKKCSQLADLGFDFTYNPQKIVQSITGN